MGALSLVAKRLKEAKKAAPFFSKADVVLDELQRGKGTGDEFLIELTKKGAKPTELRERGLEQALKGQPKMTKEQVQKLFESKPAPKVTEKVLGDAPAYEKFREDKAYELYRDDFDELLPQEQRRIRELYDEVEGPQYADYKTPGGENYREILLKLPTFEKDPQLMAMEADLRRYSGLKTDPMEMPGYRDLLQRYSALKAEKEAMGTPYQSPHYKDEPNVLAHIRVQDFKLPSQGFAVVNTKSGLKSQVFPTMEEAQAALAGYPESLQGMLTIKPAAGQPKKVLLVDEIQSDLHQEGRKKGYGPAKVAGFKYDESKKDWVRASNEEATHFGDATGADDTLWNSKAEAESKLKVGVPDLPFKKNWHELAMKRVLDYAAENGYDTVAITPGVQQVKRYEDATRKAVDKVALYGDTLIGFKGGRNVFEQKITDPSEIEELVGKDMAQKLESTPPDMNNIRSIEGKDITVGGEGMKGFYDKMIPDYLNSYGKPYGAQVGEINLGYTPSAKQLEQGAADDALLSELGVAAPASPAPVYHALDITPQMREQIRTKGQPLYGKLPVPELAGSTGAATMGTQVLDSEAEQEVQNPVQFSDNPDAMLLELMQRN